MTLEQFAALPEWEQDARMAYELHRERQLQAIKKGVRRNRKVTPGTDLIALVLAMVAEVT